MLRRKLGIVIGLLVGICMLAGCKNEPEEVNSTTVQSVTVDDLINSGATVDITEENIKEMVKEFSNINPEDVALYDIIQNIVSNGSFSPSYNSARATSVDDGLKAIEDFVVEIEKQMAILEDTETGSGLIDVSLANLGDIEGLPEGITLNIGGASLKVDFSDIDEYDFNVVNASVNLSVSSKIDTSKLITAMSDPAAEPKTPILKAFNVNVKANGSGNANFKERKANADAKMGVSAGASFCLPSGMGGKVIADVKINVKGNLDEVAIENLKKEVENKNFEAFDAFFPDSLVKLAFYNDAGECTYEVLNATTFSEIVVFLKAL